MPLPVYIVALILALSMVQYKRWRQRQALQVRRRELAADRLGKASGNTADRESGSL